MTSNQAYYREEEEFWRTRQAKLRHMSGLQTGDQDSLKHKDQDNMHPGIHNDTLQLDWKRSEEPWAGRLPLMSLQTICRNGNRAALELHKHILAMAEIREDVEQHLCHIEGKRQLLTEQKVAEQRRLIRLLDAQLKESCEGCNAQERELKDLLSEVLGQLHAYTGMLEGSKSMPDEATLSDLPARVDYLHRKKALLLSCNQPASSLQMTVAAQPYALAARAPVGLLSGARQPDEAMRALRQVVGLPTDEERVEAAARLLRQSPDAKSGNPTRQLKRAYTAMLQAVKEQHMAEKEHLIQACQKELCRQKSAYERALADIQERQQVQNARAAKESAAEALRSHPLAETPPREPHARMHANPLENGPVPEMPVLRSSPLGGEPHQPRSASLQRLSSARRRPLAVLGTARAAAAPSQQQPPPCKHQATGLYGAGHQASAPEQNPPAALDGSASRSEGCTRLTASRRPVAETPCAEEHHARCSPQSLLSVEGAHGKHGSPTGDVSARVAAAPDRTGPLASSAQHEAATTSPFQSAQPPAASADSDGLFRQAGSAAQGIRRPSLAQSAREPPTKPLSTGHKEDVSRISAGTKIPSSKAAGNVRASRAADFTQAGLMSPVSLDESPLSKYGAQGMAEPRELGSRSGPCSPTYKALAQHAASIETFLAAGDASTSARDESTALAQLMQVLNENPATDDL